MLSPGGSPAVPKSRGRRDDPNVVPGQQPTIDEHLKRSISQCTAAVQQVLETGAGKTGTVVITRCAERLG